MSECIITRRGGSGGLSLNGAVIHVTAPVGSTISFSKGGVVAKVLPPEKSHVNADDNTLADWYYAVSSSNYGTWTVSAVFETESASDTVTIDSNEQYDVSIYYTWYLYHQGNTRDSITGGWSATATASGLSFGTSYITVTAGNSMVMAGTVNKVDLTGKATLYMSMTTSSHGNNARMGIASSRITSDSNYTSQVKKENYSAGSYTLSLDVRSYQGSYYVLFSGYQTTFNIIDIWGA